jgi:hypothetical protein
MVSHWWIQGYLLKSHASNVIHWEIQGQSINGAFCDSEDKLSGRHWVTLLYTLYPLITGEMLKQEKI